MSLSQCSAHERYHLEGLSLLLSGGRRADGLCGLSGSSARCSDRFPWKPGSLGHARNLGETVVRFGLEVLE
jgi:hypothetical protein